MKKRILFSLFILFMGIYLTGCSSVYKEPGTSYKKVDFLEGAKFDIPQSFSDQATAITRVTKDGNYDENTLYYYKNGSDQYIMFCMNSFIILAQKNTDFVFDDKNNYQKGIESAPIMGMWMRAIKKGDIETGKNATAGKIVSDSVAEVALTDSLYGDFIGKMAYMSNGTDNWAIFCGCPGDNKENLSQNQMSVINNVVYSLSTYEKEEAPAYDIVVKGGTVSSNYLHVSDNTLPEDAVSDNNISYPIDNDNSVSTDEQTFTPKDSTIYDMLHIGDAGTLFAFTGKKGEYVSPVIKIEERYDYADQFVKEYVLDNPEYRNANPPTGCHWEAVRYSLYYKGCDIVPYVNIKLCGVDGEALKYHGIAYTKRTYDKMDDTIDDGTCISDAICFYAVPNGCTEYVLECGDGTIQTDAIKSAYFYIGD